MEQTETRKEKQTRMIGNPLPKRLFTLKEAGVYLGRSEYSVRCLIWDRQLPVIRQGKKQWLDIRDMDAWIDRTRTTEV
ncbi:MAG: DNA-binding protein [Desulfobacteraceae bacterium]|nr:MAG: DNA-binding protein [Desulfobacteraceae bacterium]